VEEGYGVTTGLGVLLLALLGILVYAAAQAAAALERVAAALKTAPEISKKLDVIINQEVRMAGELDTLKAAVAAENTVIDSAIVLLNGIKAALDAAIAANDPAALAALSAEIAAKTQVLSDAVVTNTP